MISAFGVEYRSISKAELKLGDKEKAGIVGAATIGGAYAGHEAVLRPDYWYNENVHKPWFEYQKSTAVRQKGISKDPKVRAEARAQAGRIETDAKANWEKDKAKRAAPVDIDSVIEGQKKKHEASQAKAVAQGKEAKPFDEKTARERMAANVKPAEPVKPFALSEDQKKAKAELERKGRKHIQPTRMTPEQADRFVEYTEKPPTKKLRAKYGYKPQIAYPDKASDQQKAKIDAKNKERKNRIGSPRKGGTNWHKSKDFFRNFPKDMPGSNYRRAGGWYSKGKTGHAVSIAMTGLGAYAAYKGSSKLVNRNQKVSKAAKIKGMKLKQLVDTPEKVLPKKMQPHYVDDNQYLMEPKLMKDPGFFVPAISYPAVGTAGYLAVRHGQKKKSRKKVGS